MRQEIENSIIKEYEIGERNRYKMLQELMEKKQDIPRDLNVEIEHSIMNFIPLINKVKIDLLM